MRASFARIAIQHEGKASQVVEMEITARGGGSIKLSIDRKTGALLN